MLNNLRWDTLSVESFEKPESSRKLTFVATHIGALHNVIRRVPTSRGAFRQCQAVDIVQKFRGVGHKYPVVIADRISEGGNAISSVRPSVRMSVRLFLYCVSMNE